MDVTMSVLVISRETISPKLLAVFASQVPGVDFKLWPDIGDPQAIEYALAWKPPPGELAKLPKLKAILSFAAGIDHLTSDPALPRHIPVVRAVSEASRLTMSGYCIAQVLRYQHRLAQYAEFQRQAVWKHLPPRDMSDTRVGVLGMGVLGADLAARLQALGFAVNGWARSARQFDGVTMFHGAEGLLPCLAASNVVVCLLPLTQETRGVLDAKAFAAMPKDGYVINVARGGHVVADDLVAAIDRGHLEGATLDVLEPEPLPADSPLWRHPKIVVTPHTSGRMSNQRVALNIIDMLREVLSGKKLANVVDWDKGY
jgi:glyoxylate/hydroxypyruvate reductase A